MFYFINNIGYYLLICLSRYRSFSIFFTMTLGIIAGDILFEKLIYQDYVDFLNNIFQKVGALENLDLSFAPEVWLGLLGMVLGTLIIVISIASQSIPKLIDLYMQDLWSLCYVWLLIVSSAHVVIIKLYGELDVLRESSRVFNIHILLPICIALAFPYIYYILKYTKPDNVINKVFHSCLQNLYLLTHATTAQRLNSPTYFAQFQHELFDALNQLDDLLEYVSFKEPKADIIHRISELMREYIKLKPDIPEIFFKISPRIQLDISFRTMTGQFVEMEKQHNFYEQKCLSVLGNIYINFLEEKYFDLASLCASEHVEIAKVAIEMEDEHVIDTLIIRFNTLLRFGIKHGLKNSEPRNLYNAVFYYGKFIEWLARAEMFDYVKKAFTYFRIYGNEVYKHGAIVPAMYFIVDVFAVEMKKILIFAHEHSWASELQNQLLKEFLTIDMPPDLGKKEINIKVLANSGTRILQIALALHFLKYGQNENAGKIFDDLLDDLEIMGEALFRQTIINSCNRLQFSGPTFWEYTDRGNMNMYYTPDQDQIEKFRALINAKVDIQLENSKRNSQKTL